MNVIEARRGRYRPAVKRAGAWLAEAQFPDGSFGPEGNTLGDLETAAICLLLTGHPEHAQRLLGYIRTSLFRNDGDFFQSEDEDILPEWTYAPAWMVISAHLNGFWEISFAAMESILCFQDSETGGLFGHPKSQQSGEGVIVPTVTGVAMLAAITTGKLAEAHAMGDYFLRLIALQPELETCFYPFYDTRHGLITEGTPELGPDYFGPFEREAPGQPYWLLGLLMAALSELYLATGEKKYLNGALKLFDFGTGCHEDLYHNTLNHKYCWGCTRLFQATGKPEHLEPALVIADFLVDIQEPQGTWWHSGAIAERAQQMLGLTVDVTSQFSIWLIKLLQVMEN